MRTRLPACVVLAAAVAALVFAPALARAGSLGLGVIAGEPTGISLKTWLDGRHAVDAALGWSFAGDTSLHLHADYLWHDFGLLRPTGVKGRLPLYYGLGARLKVHADDDGHHGNEDDTVLGVRFPVGVAWVPPSAPLDVFLEIAPVLDLLPGTDLNLNAAIGVRYWFR
jgi:hypothetical protein